MKIKIGDQIHDSKDEPIMVILSDKDKENISNMLTECHKYACFPDTINKEEAVEFMDTENPKKMRIIQVPHDAKKGE